jgi:hypothetical protein
VGQFLLETLPLLDGFETPGGDLVIGQPPALQVGSVYRVQGELVKELAVMAVTIVRWQGGGALLGFGFGALLPLDLLFLLPLFAFFLAPPVIYKPFAPLPTLG